MGSPSLGPRPKQPPAPPQLLDPTVQFARTRSKNRALSAMGRQSTILASKSSAPMQLGGTKGAY